MPNSVEKWMPSPTARQEADRLLMGRVQSHDPAARAELIERVLDPVRKTISYLSGGNDDTPDLVQSALIHILKAAPDYRGDASVEYWAKRIAVHTCAKFFEKNKRRRLLVEKSHCAALESAGLEERTEAHRARCRLAELLVTLEYKVRVTMVLHYLDDRSIQEVADLTEAPVNTVRGRLREGRKALRKKILKDPLLCTWVKEIAP